jgi:3-methyladenine DNA glycosylase AlkD
MGVADAVRAVLQDVAEPTSVPAKKRFFKAVPGGYGEGDRFLGVPVPEARRVARRFGRSAEIVDIGELLSDSYHEVRLTALFMLVQRFERADEEDRRRIVSLYIERIERVNNWDLVDSSAPHILGRYLFDHPAERKLLVEWASSGDLWRRRAAVLATFTFIREGRFDETLELARRLLEHPHDLIHKAVGWMLREIGNRAPQVEQSFLEEHAGRMPRTMLRYAIEKLPEADRKRFLRR